MRRQPQIKLIPPLVQKPPAHSRPRLLALQTHPIPPNAFEGTPELRFD